ncbi:MAG: type III polyketide synthase [Alphaproteobacteria bacterium]|nr:type III polyketide synthase [Alphaproteobacteria bacterium]
MAASKAVSLKALATAVPGNTILQSDAAEVATRVFESRYSEFNRLKSVFRTAGIHKRQMAQPIEWYLEPKNWPERGEAYLDSATLLFIEAAQLVLDQSNLMPADIDTIVTISSTGIATPGLEARALNEMGFRRDVKRVPVFGLGCAGGTSGLALATRLAQAEPGTNVLIVIVELCSLSFRFDVLTKANVVATALFGDGAAAAIVNADGKGEIIVEGGQEYTWPDTLNIMGWSVDQAGLGVIFDRAIPPFAREHLAPAVDSMLGELGMNRDDVGRFAFHPGGQKVVAAIESAMELGQGTLNVERDVLRDFGNMSAPTVFFVLERLMKKGLPKRTLISALGPGFTSSCVSLRAA